MPLIPPPPADINSCAILQVLSRKSTHADGIGAKVQQFIAVATPMVDLVAAGPFRNFTLHNRDHAKKLLHLGEHICSKETIDSLTAFECLLFIYAAFLHDMGMAITANERDQIVRSESYQDTLRGWPSLFNYLQQTRANLSEATDSERAGLETLLYQLHESALAAYLRPRHATPERYRELISHLTRASGQGDLFFYKGVPFDDILIDICVSHNLDASCLCESKTAYENRFPIDFAIAHEVANTQFVGALLRLTDILDFDRERTPAVLFESLSLPDSELPGSEVSIREWEKQMAVHTIDIRPGEIVVSATCHHPAIERAVRDFCGVIEREIKDTLSAVNRWRLMPNSLHSFSLPTNVRARIASVGYSYHDVSFRLNQAAIISLLMGEKLYTNSTVAVRELIQNALDACAVRARIEPLQRYSPRISVNSIIDKHARTWIEVADNGIGMDDHVIGEYFLKLGDSYYDSAEFQRHFRKLQADSSSYGPISRFGIGILSVFMLADVLEVHTKSSFSPRADHLPRFVRIERLGGIAFVSQSDATETGTLVRIRLRPEVKPAKTFDAIIAYLRYILIRPWYVVRINLGLEDKSFYLPDTDGDFYSVTTAIIESSRQQGLHVLPIDMSRWSQRIRGIVVLAFGIGQDGLLTNHLRGSEVRFQANTKQGNINPRDLIANFRGNRISVNGFRLGFFRMKYLFSFDSFRLSVLIDIDAKSEGGIEFDVSRERLTKQGETSLRKEITEAVMGALAQTGTLEKMSPELAVPMLSAMAKAPVGPRRELVPMAAETPNAIHDLFRLVQSAIPKDNWPRGLHRQLAAQFGITPTLAGKIINQLMRRGLVSNPNKPAQ